MPEVHAAIAHLAETSHGRVLFAHIEHECARAMEAVLKATPADVLQMQQRAVVYSNLYRLIQQSIGTR